MVKLITNTIKEKTGLESTAGIGDNFFLAKIALDLFAKKEKDGIAIMHQNDVKKKLWPITDLTKIWGIGANTAAKLNKMSIYSMGDLANSDRDYLVSKFGVMGEQLHYCANGIDESDIREVYIPKENSLTNGQVLPRDYNKKQIVTVLREMNDDLCLRMRNQHQLTCVVGLYIGYSGELGGFARQMSLLKPTDNTKTLFDALYEIFNKYIVDLPIRRISLSFGKLIKSNKYEQIGLFEDASVLEEQKNLDLMIDTLHNKYGKDIILRASALLSESTAIERHNQIGGHRK